MGDKLLVIDEGTTSTRAMLFAPDGTCLGSESAPLTQHYPAPGLVEHDAAELWDRTVACARKMIDVAGGPEAPQGLDKGFFVKPTVLGNVDPKATIAQDMPSHLMERGLISLVACIIVLFLSQLFFDKYAKKVPERMR